ncbi:MAG: LolA family protein [Planctomycetota bacterium]|jgi:outer membrane lipoprotein-sorting protein
MHISRSILLLVLLVFTSGSLCRSEECLCGRDSHKTLTFSAEAEITEALELSKEKYRPILDNLIEKHKKLEFFTAELIQVKEGGVFKRPVRKTGKISANMPDKIFLDMSDSGLVILVDGKYAWIYDTDLDDVEIWDIKSKKNNSASKMDVSSFFLGSSIKTAAELEKTFYIKAYSVPAQKATHFVLSPHKSEKQNFEKIELTIPENAIIPSFVCTIGINEDKTRPPLKTVQFISKLKTNLDNAEKPADSLFKFKPNEDMTFRMMDFNGNSKDVDIEFVNKLQLNGEK